MCEMSSKLKVESKDEKQQLQPKTVAPERKIEQERKSSRQVKKLDKHHYEQEGEEEDSLSGIRERYATISDTGFSLGHGFELKQSQIPGAGLAAWTTMPISKNVKITSYFGRLLTNKEADALPKSHMPYTIALGKDKASWVIDGTGAPTEDGSPFGTFLNDPKNPKLYNVQFTLGPDKKSVNVRTIRKLLPGEELFVNYRAAYWKTWTALFHKHPVKLSENLVPAYKARQKRLAEILPPAKAIQKPVPKLRIVKAGQEQDSDDYDDDPEYKPIPGERKKTIVYKYSLQHGFELKRSQIPGAGNGVWTTKPFRKGQTLSYYNGKLIGWKETEELEKQGGPKSAYLIRLTNSPHSDVLNGYGTPTRDGSPFGQFINDPLNPAFINTEYVITPEDNTIEVVATRDLVKGEELFLNYGDRYWAGFEEETGKKPTRLERVVLADL